MIFFTAQRPVFAWPAVVTLVRSSCTHSGSRFSVVGARIVAPPRLPPMRLFTGLLCEYSALVRLWAFEVCHGQEWDDACYASKLFFAVGKS